MILTLHVKGDVCRGVYIISSLEQIFTEKIFVPIAFPRNFFVDCEINCKNHKY